MHQMKGIRFVVDERGDRKAVLIDLNKNKELWEDFYDSILAGERADESRESLQDVKNKLFGN